MYIYFYQPLYVDLFSPARRSKGYLKLRQVTLYWQAKILHIIDKVSIILVEPCSCEVP